MPQFDLGPSNPARIIGRPGTGQVLGGVAINPETDKLEGTELVAGRPSDGGNGGGGVPASAPAPKKKKKGKKKPAKQQPAPYNPFTERFKTPSELRAEAARLAALSVPSEETLRAEQAREQLALEGLGSQLTGRVQQYVGQTGAGLAGLGSLYGSIVGQARTAGEQAAAAAGATPGLVTPAQPSESVAAQMANIGGALAGFVPAAATTGAQLVGASRQSLSKALADRASRISENTAKYLQQLQQTELKSPIPQTTAQKNPSRLGLTAQDQAFDQALANQRLGFEGQRIAQGWARIDQQLQQDIAKAGTDRKKKVQSAKDSILENINDWTGMQTVSTGKGVYDVTIDMGTIGGGPKAVQIVAASEDEARRSAVAQYPNRPVSSVIFVREDQVQRTPTPQEIRKTLVARLVNAGMNRKNAIRWVNANVVSVLSPSSAGIGGAFTGGVGGSVL